MSDQQLSDEELVNAVYGFAAEQMNAGYSAMQIQTMLVEKGLDPDSARRVLSDLDQMRSEVIASAGRKNMLYGALWCVGGIVVTVVTMSAAAGGGTFIVAWGAILFGAIQFIRGVTQLSGG